MLKLFLLTTLAAAASSCASFATWLDDAGDASPRYRALAIETPSRGTWAILDRDGANRQVEPYLSSLALGEFGSGTISSPNFELTVDRIQFTIRGHDGVEGEQGKNFIALLDGKTGKVLRKTTAPGSDALQEGFWRVGDLKWRVVRIEVTDGLSAGSFAWLGIGEIDAGPQHRFDFEKGMPKGWKEVAPPRKSRTELVENGIPFRALRQSVVPASEAFEVECGFQAERLFFLGCTVHSGHPLEVHGYIEIRYQGGDTDRIPLMVGYTLEGQFKLLSPSEAMHLHPSGDPLQYYLAVAPRPRVIDRIRIAKHPDRVSPPRITAITCETDRGSINLEPLPATQLTEEEEGWIRTHTISASAPLPEGIEETIRAAHRLPAANSGGGG